MLLVELLASLNCRFDDVPFKGVDAIEKAKSGNLLVCAQTWELYKYNRRRNATKSKAITTAAFQAFLLPQLTYFTDPK